MNPALLQGLADNGGFVAMFVTLVLTVATFVAVTVGLALPVVAGLVPSLGFTLALTATLSIGLILHSVAKVAFDGDRVGWMLVAKARVLANLAVILPAMSGMSHAAWYDVQEMQEDREEAAREADEYVTYLAEIAANDVLWQARFAAAAEEAAADAAWAAQDDWADDVWNGHRPAWSDSGRPAPTLFDNLPEGAEELTAEQVAAELASGRYGDVADSGVYIASEVPEWDFTEILESNLQDV